MQSVSFRNLDELYEYLPDDELQMLRRLRELVYDCIPRIKEKLSYQVPFFRINKTICYIWPGSVPWGNTTFKGVQFGLTQGHLLDNSDDYFNVEDRKYVRTKVFKKLADIDFNRLRLALFEAYEIDYQSKQTKN